MYSITEPSSEKGELEPLLPRSRQDLIRWHDQEEKTLPAYGHIPAASRRWYSAVQCATRDWYDRKIRPHKIMCTLAVVALVIYTTFFAITFEHYRRRRDVDTKFGRRTHFLPTNAWEAVNVLANIEDCLIISLVPCFAALLCGVARCLEGENEVDWVAVLCQARNDRSTLCGRAYLGIWLSHACGHYRSRLMGSDDYHHPRWIGKNKGILGVIPLRHRTSIC